MVAKITFPKRMEAALNYNENKVSQGKAECLHASNFLKDAAAMNFYNKLEGFEIRNELNDRAQTKTLHVSLNFDPSEKISNNKLLKIAADYMDKIGFGDQPYLIYKHEDAGHPHIHVVATTIRNDGSRINTHNIGRNQSEKARKEIEQVYKLVRAEDQKRSQQQTVKPVNAEKVIYGKTETKRSITNVLDAVLNRYMFSSLPELNAILKQYNVVADRGKEEGRIYKHNGLVYRVLDADGNKKGVPIKASSINSQPTLAKLEKLFEQNEAEKQPLKKAVKAKLDEVLAQQPASMIEFKKLLEQKNIYTVLRQNEKGRIYGITFVDNASKVVFNGSDLGKAYTAGHLQSCVQAAKTATKEEPEQPERQPAGSASVNTEIPEKQIQQQKEQTTSVINTPALDDLLSAKNQSNYMPFQLIRKKRKRKKRSLGL